jgi:hypothetical protein
MEYDEKRAKVEKQVIEYLTKRKFKEASLMVAAYEAKQARPRGIGIDWKHYNPSRDIEILNTIFGSKPRIIAQLGDEKLEALRLGAAMMELWGTNMATQWIPASFETSLPFDNDTAARMLLFYAIHQRTLEGYRGAGLKYVELFPAPDSCEACKKLVGKQYILTEAPELPYEYCTHKLGCRCVLLPVVEKNKVT